MKKVTMDAKDLISKMLIKDIQKRPTATQVLQHPWVQKNNIPQTVTVNYNNLKAFMGSTRLKKIALTYIATQLGQ